jgi:hypothetical protein
MRTRLPFVVTGDGADINISSASIEIGDSQGSRGEVSYIIL